MCDKLHHFMQKIVFFASNYGIITNVKLNYASKTVEKEKWAGLKI